MLRTITVKGVGKILTKPDFVVLSMKLKAKDEEYDKAMDKACLLYTSDAADEL